MTGWRQGRKVGRTIATKAFTAALYTWWVPTAAVTMGLHWIQVVSLWVWSTIGAALYGARVRPVHASASGAHN